MHSTQIMLSPTDLERLDAFYNHPHDDVDAEIVEEIAADMRALGYNDACPIIVRGSIWGDDGHYTLVNGRHRRAACLATNTTAHAIVISYDLFDALEEELGGDMEDMTRWIMRNEPIDALPTAEEIDRD